MSDSNQNKSTNEPNKVLIRCHCGYEWSMDAKQIPKGEMYEVKCPKCGALLKRKCL